MSPLPFQVLELNLTSAQDLSPVSKNMSTYAIAWVDPNRKVRTRVDQGGTINPTWNEKFVFRVDQKFLISETSSLKIEIYASGWLRDTLVGSVRVLISNLLPQNVQKQKNSSNLRLMTLQIRRPSGKPRGILNVGVSLLDCCMRSMPLHAASAVGFHDIMDVKLEQQYCEEKNNKVPKIKNPARTQSNCAHVKGRMEDEEEEENLLHSYKAGDEPVRNGSVVNGSSRHTSVVNGSQIGVSRNGSIRYSDVGPSASIVANAVAWGLHPIPLMKPHNPESCILAEWTMDSSNTGKLKSKIERWRMGLPGNHDNESMTSYQTNASEKSKGRKKFPPRVRRRSSSFDDRNGMFSCFLNGYGCEFMLK